jgi:chitin disaccharide deacetylase
LKNIQTFIPLAALAALAVLSAALLAAGGAETPQQQFLKQIGCEKALIVNADDLGRSKWSNEGILKGFNEGILTSTSLMATGLAADDAYRMIRENPKLDVGVHLVLARDDAPGDNERPLSPIDKVKDLVDADGLFITDANRAVAAASKQEIELELTAQVKAVAGNGVDITHLDCHKGFYHTYDKKSLGVTLALASLYDVPIRWAGSSADKPLVKIGLVVPDRMFMMSMSTPHEKKKKMYLEGIAGLKPGITEFVLHPATGGYSEAEAKDRQSELSIALDPDIRQALKDNNVCLVGYRDLRDFQRKRRTP